MRFCQENSGAGWVSDVYLLRSNMGYVKRLLRQQGQTPFASNCL